MIGSLQDREQEQVTNAAKLHALLRYILEDGEIRSEVRSWVSEIDILQFQGQMNSGSSSDAADRLQIDEQVKEESIQQLSVG